MLSTWSWLVYKNEKRPPDIFGGRVYLKDLRMDKSR